MTYSGAKKMVCWMGLTLLAFTIAIPAEAKERRKRKEVDVEELKKQYWSKQPNIDVVQNRLYPKSRRFSMSFLP